MSLETELQRRLEASASAFHPDPAVLVEAEHRAKQRRRAQQATRVLAAAAVVLIVGVVALIVTGGTETRNPIVDSPPLEREDTGETPDLDPDVPAIDEEALPSDDVPDPAGEDGDAGRADEGAEADTADADPAGTWSALPSGPLSPRSGAAAAWTGEQVFVWGGRIDRSWDLPAATDGALFDPASGSWETITDAPIGVAHADAAWTGDEVLILGGSEDAAGRGVELLLITYDPIEDAWRVEDPPPLATRAWHSVTWTGEELIVWGGLTLLEDEVDHTPVRMHADGAAFDPTTRTWRTLADAPISARGAHGAVWNGRRLVIFGGGASDQIEGEFGWSAQPADAAAYDPTTDSWATIEAPGEIGPIVGAHWTGDRIVYWTGHTTPDQPANWLGAGGVWNTATGEVAPMAAPPFEGRRDQAPTVWAAQLGRLLTWGGAIGEGGNHHWHTGASYDPEADAWSLLADSPLGARNGHATVWTGSELIVWGGTADGFEQANDVGWSPEYQLRDDGAIWHLEAPEE